ANRAVELRSPQAVEKAAIHRPVAELPDRAGVAVREDALMAEFSGNVLEARSDLIQRLVPGDALEELGLTPFGERAFRNARVAPHGIEQALRGVDAIEVTRNFPAEEPARDRMCRVAGDLHRAAGELVDRHQHAAGVRAIVRTDGVHSSRLGGIGGHSYILGASILRTQYVFCLESKLCVCSPADCLLLPSWSCCCSPPFRPPRLRRRQSPRRRTPFWPCSTSRLSTGTAVIWRRLRPGTRTPRTSSSWAARFGAGTTRCSQATASRSLQKTPWGP